MHSAITDVQIVVPASSRQTKKSSAGSDTASDFLSAVCLPVSPRTRSHPQLTRGRPSVVGEKCQALVNEC